MCKDYLLLLLIILAPLSAYAESVVSLFGSEVIVKENGSLVVTDRLDIKSDGTIFLFGVMRQLPEIIKNKADKEQRLSYTVNFCQRDGAKQEYFTESKSNTFNVYMGKKGVKLPLGNYSYLLQYEVRGAIDFSQDYDNLKWNATGDYLVVPIESVISVIRLPKNILRGSVLPTLKNAYTGTKEEKEKHYAYHLEKNGNIKYWTTKHLPPRKSLVFNIGWPKGFVSSS